MAHVRPGTLLENACPHGTRRHLSWTLCSTIIIPFVLVLYLYFPPHPASACLLRVHCVGTCVYESSTGARLAAGRWRLEYARRFVSNRHHDPASSQRPFKRGLLEALRYHRRRIIPSLVFRTPDAIRREHELALESLAAFVLECERGSTSRSRQAPHAGPSSSSLFTVFLPVLAAYATVATNNIPGKPASSALYT